MATDTETPETPTARFGAWMKSSAANIPMLPETAMRVVSIAADPDITISGLAQVISKDQVLATRLLSLANSAYYASSVDVLNVPEAIMRVGAATVRNLAVTLSISSRMLDAKIYGSQGQALADHGIGTAYLARLVGDDAGLDPEEAFLCGLLHDIGKMLILKWHYDEAARSGQPMDAGELAVLIREWHAAAALRAFTRWGLPSSLEAPVLHHHSYAHATEGRRLAAVTYLANRLSHRYGFGCVADGNDPLTDPVMAELGLDADWLGELDRKAPGLFAVARGSLS